MRTIADARAYRVHLKNCHRWEPPYDYQDFVVETVAYDASDAIRQALIEVASNKFHTTDRGVTKVEPA